MHASVGASMLCTIGFLWMLLACGPVSQSGRYIPEVPQPTEARINELARVDAAPVMEPAAMRVEVMPRICVEGKSVEVRCYVPRDSNNRGVTVATAYESMIRPLGNSSDEFVFVLSVKTPPCGPTEVVCAVEKADGTIVKKRGRITVRGECNSFDELH